MWTFSKFLVFSKGSTPKLNTSFRQAIKCASCSVVSVSLQPQGLHAASQPPLPMEFSKQDTGVGSPSSPRDLPNPGIEPGSPASQADSLSSKPPRKPCESVSCNHHGLSLHCIIPIFSF